MINFMQPQEEIRRSAVLLLGPTGVGKTPLGRLMEKIGLWGIPCIHFDFGHELRRSVRDESCVLNAAEKTTVNRMLRTGALLEDGQFPIAEKLLDAFLEENGSGDRTLIVLNGLPRHTGQADKIKPILRVVAVVNLKCDPETVRHRIAADAGGDRGGRKDDSIDAIKRKLEIFRQRTAPLLEYYCSSNVGIIEVEVGTSSTAADMLAKINGHAGYKI